jgi:xanthine/uracil permease
MLLIILGFLGKFGALAAAIPGPVIGGLYCTMFGLISAVGVRQLAKCDLHSDRNLFIAGFSLFMGLSVPAYFSSVATTDDMVAGQTLAVYTPTASVLLDRFEGGVQSVILSIGSTAMAVAAILGTVLDNLIPGSRKERGLLPDENEMLVPEAGNVDEGPRDDKGTEK